MNSADEGHSVAADISKNWCGRWESNPHEEKSPEDFLAVCGFRRPDALLKCRARFAVWTIPSPCFGAPKFRRRPSSLYTFPEFLFRAWLGIATKNSEVSPNLSGSAAPVSRRALNLFKSSASAIPPRPHRLGSLKKSLAQGGGPNSVVRLPDCAAGHRRYAVSCACLFSCP